MPDRFRARLALFVLPAVALAAGLHARALGSRALHAFVHYETPFAPAHEGAARPPLAPRTVVVLVDGLGWRASRGLPFLDALRARGADYRLRVGVPSLSLPARAVMLAGAWHDVHGQISNYRPRPLRVEHLLGAVRARGGVTALSASRNVHRLFEPHVALAQVIDEQPETAAFGDYARSLEAQVAAGLGLIAQRPRLAWVELYVVDEAGHGWGATSPEYGRARSLADDALHRLAGAVDLGGAALVVVADHGHRPAGGHGGGEEDVLEVPLVMAGAGVRPGARGEGTQVDVAPTLAALLGVPVPPANQGRPLLDALALEPARRAELLRHVLAQREAFAAHYLARVGVTAAEAGLAAPPPTATDADALARLDDLDGALARARAHRLAREAPRRRVEALLPPLALLAALTLAWRVPIVSRRAGTRAVLAGLVAAAAYYALLPALGLAYSLSAVNKDEWTEAFFRRDMVLAAACVSAAAAVAMASVRSASRAARAEAAWVAAAAFLLPLAVKIAVARAGHDVLLGWQVPDQWWTFGFYLDTLAFTAAALVTPLLGALAAIVRTAPRPAARVAEAPAA